MSEAYQETREIPGHHMLQGNDLIRLIFLIWIFQSVKIFESLAGNKKSKIGVSGFFTRISSNGSSRSLLAEL